MSEEELHRPSDQTDFKVEVNGQVQVQVLVHLHCSGLSQTAHHYQICLNVQEVPQKISVDTVL